MQVNLKGCNHAKPAHSHVKRSGKNGEAIGKPQLKQNSGNRDRPDNAEQRPAPTAFQVHEQKRRVSSRDERVNRAMIKNHQGVLGAGRRGAVIKGGSGVKTDQGDSVDRTTDDLPAAAVEQS